MTLTWRALDRADIPAVTGLLNAVADADDTGERLTEELVAESLEQPRFDLATDSFSAWAGDRLVGVGTVQLRPELVAGRAMVGLQGCIDPQLRGRGWGRALLDRLEARAAQLASDRFPTVPVRLRTSGGLEGSSAQRLLEQGGYAPDTYFALMQVELADWADPEGSIRACEPDEQLLAATREAHNDAFRDHRNSSPIPPDMWEFWGRSSATRPGLSRVVVEQGRVLAYAVASQSEPGVVHLDLVGTRREARGRGLARDVLIGSLRAARDAGYRTSELEVDRASPTGADRLYTSVGYRQVRVVSRYARDLPPGGRRPGLRRFRGHPGT